MRLSRRVRTLAWEGLGWSVAAGLALALVATLFLTSMRQRDLEAQLAAAAARDQIATRSLTVCQATTATLENTLSIVTSSGAKGGASAGPLTSEELLRRPATGADACARALEAEALVREAAR